MARKLIFLAFALLAIVGMASAWSDDTALPPAEDDFDAQAPSPSDNVIGPLDGSATSAAPVGAPVSENVFPELSPTEERKSAGTTFGVSVVASVVATTMAASLLF